MLNKFLKLVMVPCLQLINFINASAIIAANSTGVLDLTAKSAVPDYGIAEHSLVLYRISKLTKPKAKTIVNGNEKRTLVLVRDRDRSMVLFAVVSLNIR